MKLILSLLAIFLAIHHYECLEAFFKTGHYNIGKMTKYGRGIPMGRFRFTVENRNSNQTTKISFFVVNEISGEISRKGDAWKVTGVRKTNLDAERYKKYEDILMDFLKDLDTSGPVNDNHDVLTMVHKEISLHF